MAAGTRPQVMTHFKRYGLIGGLAVGLLGGVMVSGPHLREWSLLQSLVVMLGGGATGAVVGYLAISLFMGSLTPESGAGIGDGGIGGSGYGDAGSGGSSDGGGNGGGDG
jgi:hypothetical protein